MTEPKPDARETPPCQPADRLRELHFLRSVFAELTGECPRPSASQAPAAVRPDPRRLVRTRPKCLK
jgi:hypothetical protein